MTTGNTAPMSDQKTGIFPYALSILCFIPILGVFACIGFIVFGLTTKKKGGKNLIVISIIGIMFSIFITYSGIHSAFHGAAYDKVHKKLMQENLSSLVVYIEYYKMQNGKYPNSLEELMPSLPSDGHVGILDLSQVNPFDTVPEVLEKSKPYYYKAVDPNHYYLLAVGPDGIPFTSDDILPAIDPQAKTGLLIKDSSRSPADNNDKKD